MTPRRPVASSARLIQCSTLTSLGLGGRRGEGRWVGEGRVLEDVGGGERGQEDTGGDEEVLADGACAARHHLGPADAAQGVAGEGEADDTEDPFGMHETQREDLVEGDSAEGVPEEEEADED